MRCASTFTALLFVQSCMDASRVERPQVPLATDDEEAQLPIGGSQETVFSGEAAQVLAAIQQHGAVLQAPSRSSAENSTALLGVSQLQEASGFVSTKLLKNILKKAFGNMQLKGEEMGEEGENGVKEDCVSSNSCPFRGTIIITHPNHGVKVGCFEHLTMKEEGMQMNVLAATQVHLKLHIDLNKVVIAGVTLDGMINVAVNLPNLVLRIWNGMSDLEPESAATWSANVIGCFHNRKRGGTLAGATLEACMRLQPDNTKVDELVSFLLSKFQPEIVNAINEGVEANVDNFLVKKILMAHRGVMMGATAATRLRSFGRRKQQELKCLVGRHKTAELPFDDEDRDEDGD